MSIAFRENKIDQIYYNGQGVDKIYKGEDLVYDRSLQNKFEYFYVYANGGLNSGRPSVGQVGLKNYGDNAPNLEYSRDGVNWTTWDYSYLELVPPQESEESSPIYSFIFFRGYNPNGFSQSSSVYSYFHILNRYYSIQGNIHVGGNIMSLLYKDSFWKEDEAPNNTIPNDYCFYKLFYDSAICSCLGIGYYVDGQGQGHALNILRLPATNLKAYCYSKMFNYSTKMVYGPLILPAKSISVTSCYHSMFRDCESLIATPKLPATTLMDNCYAYMFMNCTALTTAYDLPAKNIGYSSYQDMFNGCTSLVKAPEIKGKYINHYSLSNMFSGCTNLNYIKILVENPTGYLGTFDSWVYRVPSTGTFVKKRGVTYPSGTSGIPEGWTVEEID